LGSLHHPEKYSPANPGPHESIGSYVNHSYPFKQELVSKARGRFTKWSGQIRFDPEDPAASSVEVTIDPASIDTADAQRDAHLKLTLEVEAIKQAAQKVA
jgi:polyisoprenoid-binding protein YceI